MQKFRTIRVLIFAIVSILSLPSCAQDDDFFSMIASQSPGADLTLALRDFVRPAMSPVTGTNDWQGRASMVDLGSRQLMIFKESTSHESDAGNWNIVYSTDEFRTKTANNTKIGGGASAFFPYSGGTAPTATSAGDICLFKCPNGDVLMISQQTKVATSPNDWVTNWVHRSTDGGDTWTSDGDLGDKISVSDKRAFWAFFDSIIDGNDLYLAFAEYVVAGGKDQSRVRLVKTSDNGATFSDVGTIFPYSGSYPSAPNETAIENLGGGHFLAISRTWTLLYVLKSESFDYGATWSAYTEISVSQFNSFGLHQPRLYKFPGDKPTRVWLTARWFDNTDDTKNLVCYSDDAGSTWVKFPLDSSWPGDSGYVDMIKRDDGTYYITGYFGTHDAASVTSYLLEAYDSTVYSAEYQSILNIANHTPYPIPSAHWRAKQNQLYADLSNAGILAKTDALVLGMQDGSSNFGLMNWVSPSTALAAQPANQLWINGQGWRNAGSSGHTVLNWKPSNGVNFQQNSAAYAVGHTGFTPPAAAFGSESSNNVNRMIFQGASTTTAQAPINSAGGVLTYQLHNAGRYYGERTASNATETFFNNSSINTTTTTSASRSTTNIVITAFMNYAASIISAMQTGAVQYLWFGAPLTSTERGNFDTIMATYTTP